MKLKLFYLVILLLFLLFCSMEVHPYPQDEDLLNLLISAEDYYNQGIDNPNTSYFTQAVNIYTEICNRIEREQQARNEYGDYYPKVVYKIGWCYFRLAELSGKSENLDLAYSRFNSIPISSPESIGIYSAYMAGDSKLREVVSTKFEKLLSGPLSKNDVNNLRASLDLSRAKYQAVARDLHTPYLLRRCAEIRIEDVDYEIAKILQASDDPSIIGYFEDNVNYRAQTDDEAELRKIINYSDAMKRLEMYLISPDINLGLAQIFENNFFGRENFFRRATKAQKDADYNAAIRSYQNSITDFSEASYWLGYVQLMSENQLNRKLLRLIRDNFNRFKTASEFTLMDNRINRLHRSVLDKLSVLNIALGDSGIERPLEDRDLQFLIRLAATMSGNERISLLENIYQYLDRIAIEKARANEANFYKGLVKSLEAEALGGNRRTQKFFEASNLLDNVGGDYEFEAKYIRARCLSYAEKFQESASLFRELIKNKESLRSSFYLGEIFRHHNQCESARRCFDAVVNAIEKNPKFHSEYGFWLESARIGLTQCIEETDNKIINIQLDGLPLDKLQCPEALSEVEIDGERELIFYEALQQLNFIKQKYAEESLEQLKKFGLPKKTIYPCKRRLQGSFFLANSFENFFAPISDTIIIDETWGLKILVLNENEVPIKDCEVKNIRTGEVFTCDNDGFWVDKKENTRNEIVPIKITKPKYYTLFHQFKPHIIRIGAYLDTAIVLSEKIAYNRSDEKPCQENCQLLRPHLDGNFVMRNLSNLPIGPNTELFEDFESSVSFRDFVYNTKSQRFLAVNCRNGKALWRYNEDGYSGAILPLTFKDSNDSLSSPEGIAVDSDGNIYVADWGNHRVVAFKPDGSFWYEFGSFGEHSKEEENKGVKAKFIFPTRVAIEEDTNGINFDGKKIYCEKHVLVADRYGIHKFDSKGHYLDTPINKKNSDLEEGSFYAFTIKGYGKGSEIYLVNREKRKVVLFSSKN